MSIKNGTKLTVLRESSPCQAAQLKDFQSFNEQSYEPDNERRPSKIFDEIDRLNLTQRKIVEVIFLSTEPISARQIHQLVNSLIALKTIRTNLTLLERKGILSVPKTEEVKGLADLKYYTLSEQVDAKNLRKLFGNPYFLPDINDPNCIDLSNGNERSSDSVFETALMVRQQDLAQEGVMEMTKTERRVLDILKKLKEATPTQIGEIQKTTSSAAQQTLTKLCARGMVGRRSIPSQAGYIYFVIERNREEVSLNNGSGSLSQWTASAAENTSATDISCNGTSPVTVSERTSHNAPASSPPVSPSSQSDSKEISAVLGSQPPYHPLNSFLPQLEKIELLILKVITQNDGINPISLGRKVRRSRYAVLPPCEKLAHLGLITRHPISLGGQQSYLFYQVEDLRTEDVEEAINYKDIEILNSAFSSVGIAFIQDLRSRLMDLRPLILNTLLVVADAGETTTNELCPLHPDKIHRSTLHDHLVDLIDLKLVEREESYRMGGREYIYFLPLDLTPELIEQALSIPTSDTEGCPIFEESSDTFANGDSPYAEVSSLIETNSDTNGSSTNSFSIVEGVSINGKGLESGTTNGEMSIGTSNSVSSENLSVSNNFNSKINQEMNLKDENMDDSKQNSQFGQSETEKASIDNSASTESQISDAVISVSTSSNTPTSSWLSSSDNLMSFYSEAALDEVLQEIVQRLVTLETQFADLKNYLLNTPKSKVNTEKLLEMLHSPR